MTHKKKPRSQNLIVACIVAFAILLLLLRMFVFVHGHGRRTFRTAAGGTRVSTTDFRPASDRPAPAWTDRFGDGTPDFLRLTAPADQAAFRQWFTLIAGYQAIRPKAELPAEITDCASLLRFSYREALKRHDDSWFLATGIEVRRCRGRFAPGATPILRWAPRSSGSSPAALKPLTQPTAPLPSLPTLKL